MQNEKQHHNCKYDWDLYWPNIKRMKDMREGWDTISARMGIPVGAIRAEWARRERTLTFEVHRIKDVDIQAMRAQRAPDDRDITARFMGDPRKGESALCRKIQNDQAQDQEAPLMQRLYPLQEQVSGVLHTKRSARSMQ